MNTKYISFCGTFIVPDNIEELEMKYQSSWYVTEDDTEVDLKFIPGLDYKIIDILDSLTVELAIIEDRILGHIYADCHQAGWTESTFVRLDENNNPLRPKENSNPNPIRQLVNSNK